MGMPGDLLKMFEKVEGLNYGTRFYKADLHFHTPASEDARGPNRYNFNPYKIRYPKRAGNPNYEEEVNAIHAGILKGARVIASNIVQRFLELGLSIVAVTDHNAIGTIWADKESEKRLMDLAAPTWYELIDDQAQNVNSILGRTELLVLPGVEISTTGVHILAIFPPQNPRRKVHFMICDLLAEVGFGVDMWGKNPEAGNASVYDALELILQKGGLAIPAHIDGSDQALLDLYKLTSDSMENVLQSKDLRAVEIVDPAKFSRPNKKIKMSLKARFDEKRRKVGLPYLAYFQGSDAHDLASIAKRFTYLKMTEPTFAGLQTAIKMPSSRVRIEDSFKQLDGLYLHGLVFDHPFLGSQSLHFNHNLNCISGKLASGKTFLFNLIQGVVNPEFPTMDGSAILFVEKNAAGVCQYFAYARKKGGREVSVFAIDPTAKTVTPLTLELAEAASLQPKFYNAEQIEKIINDPAELQAFLRKNFGEPTPDNVSKFNDRFSSPRFLDEKREPLLTLALGGAGYSLAMNLCWRRDDVCLANFSNLTASQRKTAMMCMIILSSQFGPVMIDAPEEEFDHEDMSNFLVPVIQEHKDAHQILLFTNHPILAVNTDPDNYLLMQLQDGKRKKIVAGFAIDAIGAQKDLLLNILEGNLETFRKRASRYE